MERIKVKVNLIKIAFLLLTLKVMFSSSFIVPWNSLVDNLFIALALFIFILKFSKTRLTINQFFLFGFLGLGVLYTCIKIKQYDLLITLIAIFLLKDEKIDEYIHFVFVTETIFLVVHVGFVLFLSAIGFGGQFWVFTGSRLRFNGGFIHPNVLSCYILSCMLMYVWEKFERLTRLDYFFLVIITALSYLMTRSRTGFILDIVLIIFIYLGNKNLMGFNRLIFKYSKFIFPFFTGIIALSMTQYLSGSEIVYFFDELLTGRLKYGAYAFSHSGITFMPKFLDYVQSGTVSWDYFWQLNTFTFDNLYSCLLIQLGLIWGVIFTVLLCKLFKVTDIKCHIFLCIWMLFSMTETLGLNCFKFFPILLFVFLFKEKEDVRDGNTVN